MARNRQRAKERQAARRAERQAGRAGAPGANGPDGREDDGAATPAPEFAEDPALAAPSGRSDEAADLAVGAPPEDLGHPETVLDPDDVAVDEDELDEDDADATATGGPRGVRGGRAGEAEPTTPGRGRVLAFLAASWAELQRVQWPDRRALTTLTGVVLGFVLLAGGYLGLLDAIFSKVIQAIL